MRAIDEMKFYEVKPDGSLGAIAGKNDDIEICTAGGIWLATKYLPKPFYVKEETGYRKKKVKTESDF